VQVDPKKPKLNPPGSTRLKRMCDVPLSNIAFEFKLRRYTAGGLRLGQVKHIMMQLFAALEHCHAREVLHRDVKVGRCRLTPAETP